MPVISFPISPTDGQQFTCSNGVAYQYQSDPGVWRSLRYIEIPFPAGDDTDAGIAIGTSTSGLSQLAAHTLTFVNEWQAGVGSVDFKGVHILDNKSMVIGTEDPEAALTNQSALEINAVAGQQALQINEWGPESAACEPVIFYRSRGTAVGSFAAVLGGDSISSLQIQGDLGDGTLNVAAANIIGRVQPGWTNPGTGTATRRLGGNIVIATAPGDGATPITSRLEIQGDGDVNVVGGNIQMGGTTVIDSTGTLIVSGFRSTRVAIADDAVYVFQPYGNSTALISFLSTNTAATNAPAGTVFTRVNSLIAPQVVSVIGSGGMTFSTGVLTGTTGADTKLNWSSDAAGNVYVENRLGSSRTYTFHVISGAA